MPRDRVRVVWMEGPQGYGRTAADDAGFEAAFLAKEIGRPVRVQWMRRGRNRVGHEGPGVRRSRCAAALDAQGNLVALDYDARAADHNHLGYNEPDTVLIAQLTGMRRATPARGGARRRRRTCTPSRTGARRRTSSACRWCGRRRCAPATCAIPNGPQVTFASESFIDELAAAAKADPVEFRLKLLTASTTDDSGFKRARSIAVRQGGGGDVRLGRRVRRRSRAAPATSSPAAASPTRIRSQTVVARDRRSRGESPDRPRLGEAARLRARLRAGRSIPKGCAGRSRAACCTR